MPATDYYTCYDTAYCPDELQGTPDFYKGHWRNRSEVRHVAIENVTGSVWAEFGVGIGKSARYFLERLPDSGVMYLFDSWQGLPEDWVLGESLTDPVGHYKSAKPTKGYEGAVFVDGWFRDTLPYPFPDRLGLIHIDCDLYSSTRDVLFGANEYIGPGTVIVFDEILGYQYYADHEYKAFCEWREETGKQVKWLAKERFAAACVVV